MTRQNNHGAVCHGTHPGAVQSHIAPLTQGLTQTQRGTATPVLRVTVCVPVITPVSSTSGSVW